MPAARNFHVPLPERTYRELREVAAQLRRPATQLGREAIEGWLKQARQALIAQTIQAYAEHVAGTEEDLDKALEKASMEYLESAEKPQD